MRRARPIDAGEHAGYRLVPGALTARTPADVRAAFGHLAAFFRGGLRPSRTVAAEYLRAFTCGDWRGTEQDKAHRLLDAMEVAGLIAPVRVRRGAKAPGPGAGRSILLSSWRGAADAAVHRGTRNGAPSLRTKAAAGNFGHSLCANWCAACARDTPHHGYRCLLCGAVDAPPIRRDGLRSRPLRRRAWARGFVRVAADRRAALRAAAEASRRKFEGGGS